MTVSLPRKVAFRGQLSATVPKEEQMWYKKETALEATKAPRRAAYPFTEPDRFLGDQRPQFKNQKGKTPWNEFKAPCDS